MFLSHKSIFYMSSLYEEEGNFLNNTKTEEVPYVPFACSDLSDKETNQSSSDCPVDSYKTINGGGLKNCSRYRDNTGVCLGEHN